jgi:hypothetical protein
MARYSVPFASGAFGSDLQLSADLAGTGAPVYTESGIAGLAAAQEHVASSLTGGLYIQADQPQRLDTAEAGLVKAEGGTCSP